MGGISKGGEKALLYSDCLSHFLGLFLKFSVISRAAGLWLPKGLGDRTRRQGQLVQVTFPDTKYS